jgi:uncharacterized membrane protein YfcA
MELDSVAFALALAAFFAGFVDAVVGGGGLIQLPALLAAYPQVAPASLFATNKVASIVGTTSAAIQYSRRVRTPWALAGPGAVAALLGSWWGAKAVSYLSPEAIRPLVLVLLVFVAIYTFIKKDFGLHGREEEVAPSRGGLIAAAIGLIVGFYDGFFGPGTGSFFIVLLIHFLGMDFLRASVTAKILNVATNLAAIAYFSANVKIMWMLGALMAASNLAGALTGSRMALRHGTAFVRMMFLLVVSALILKLSYDLIARGAA